MIGAILTFRYGEKDNFDPGLLRHIAETARPTFEGMPGLRSKTFTINAARREAVNIYVWESEDAARRLSGEQVMERVTTLYGVRPTVDLVEIAVLVDNAARR
ncbi:MAG: YdhR family protein [Steroidobacteraceae bacterium]|jgi:hypothetical protein|nr:YdhR family protein [Steroidobacteraceae bacterium]